MHSGSEFHVKVINDLYRFTFFVHRGSNKHLSLCEYHLKVMESRQNISHGCHVNYFKNDYILASLISISSIIMKYATTSVYKKQFEYTDPSYNALQTGKFSYKKFGEFT